LHENSANEIFFVGEKREEKKKIGKVREVKKLEIIRK
jgi:hypothetical protein